MSFADLQVRVDAIIAEAAGSSVIVFKRLLTTEPDAPNVPYKEEQQRQYEEDGTLVTAWIKLKAQGPGLPASQLELVHMGENVNVDAVVLVSKIENDRKGLDLGLDAISYQIEHNGMKYETLKVDPRSHVGGDPSYFRIEATRK